MSSEQKPKTYTFDIFDTVITRSLIKPSALFLLLGQRLYQEKLISIRPDEFSDCRKLSEKQAYEKLDGESVTLEEVYEILAPMLQLSSEESKKIYEIELLVEKEMMRVVPETARKIKKLHSKGISVSYLSDMYMSSAFLIECLKGYQLWKPGDACYVSCEHRGWKKDGRLFQKFYESTSIPLKQVEHTGNHPKADVQAPQAMGIQIRPFYEANPNRYEEAFAECTDKTNGVSALMAGASRYTRLSINVGSEKEEAIRDVASGVAAPMLFAYVQWVLKETRSKGIKRLYFVSRDGQILHEMAKKIIQNTGDLTELRYFYGSRQACQLASLREVGIYEKKWMQTFERFITPRIYFERFDLTLDEVLPLLKKYALSDCDDHKILNPAERERLRALTEDEEFHRQVLEKAKLRRENFEDYLEQEGLFDKVPSAIVDLGWRGFLQYSITNVLKEKGKGELTGFYLGLWPEALPDFLGEKHAYLFDRRVNKQAFPGLEWQIYAMAEAFASADHALVWGYEKREGRISPIFKKAGHQSLAAWGYSVMRESLLFYVDEILKAFNPSQNGEETKEALVRSFKLFYLTPTEKESMAWGSFPYETDQQGVWSFPLARPYGWNDLISCFRYGKPRTVHNDHWHLGALRLSSKPMRAGFKIAKSLYQRKRKKERAYASL